MLFMHPQPAAGTTQNPRLQGKGGLGNTIGNPLETTVFLSHLIFEGTLDRFPGLKICARARRRLSAVLQRSVGCAVRPRRRRRDCKALKRKPSEYFRRKLLIDTMIFHEDGLRHLVAEVGVGQIFYGTDYPFDWPVGHRLRPERDVPEQCPQGSDSRRQPDQAAEDYDLVPGSSELPTRGQRTTSLFLFLHLLVSRDGGKGNDMRGRHHVGVAEDTTDQLTYAKLMQAADEMLRAVVTANVAWRAGRRRHRARRHQRREALQSPRKNRRAPSPLIAAPLTP